MTNPRKKIGFNRTEAVEIAFKRLNIRGWDHKKVAYIYKYLYDSLPVKIRCERFGRQELVGRNELPYIEKFVQYYCMGSPRARLLTHKGVIAALEDRLEARLRDPDILDS